MFGTALLLLLVSSPPAGSGNSEAPKGNAACVQAARPWHKYFDKRLRKRESRRYVVLCANAGEWINPETGAGVSRDAARGAWSKGALLFAVDERSPTLMCMLAFDTRRNAIRCEHLRVGRMEDGDIVDVEMATLNETVGSALGSL